MQVPSSGAQFPVEESALGLTKSQNLLLQLLLAVPTLAIHGTRRRQPERETPSTISPAFAPSLPHAQHCWAGSTNSLETSVGHARVLSSPSSTQALSIHFSTLDTFPFLISSLVSVFTQPFLIQ